MVVFLVGGGEMAINLAPLRLASYGMLYRAPDFFEMNIQVP
jgi:hypothetical protein